MRFWQTTARAWADRPLWQRVLIALAAFAVGLWAHALDSGSSGLLEANTLLTISLITREALRVLENNLTFTRLINRQYDDRFGVEG